MTKNYLSVQKHERIAKMMLFIEEHPGLPLEDVVSRVHAEVFENRLTNKKVQEYFYMLVGSGDIFLGEGGKVYPTDHTEDSQ